MRINTLFLFLFFISGCVFCGGGGSGSVCANQKPSAQMRMSYLDAHPELRDTRIYYLIEDGVVGKGMTKDQVLAAWGVPDKQFTSKKFGGSDVWYYYCNWKARTYVYFKNGLVVGGD